MKKIKKENIVAMTFLTCIIVIFIGIIPTFYQYYTNAYIFEKDNRISINWEERYPFSEDILEDNDNIDFVSSKLDEFKSVVQSSKTKITNFVNNGILFRYPISELYCKLEKMIGYKRIVSYDGSVLALDNDYYSFQSIIDKTNDNEIVVNNISDFQQWLNNKGIDYLHVLEPKKTSPTDENNIYEGYIDYQNYNSETMEKLFEESNVNFLNLQELADEKGNRNELFYSTDHHWKPTTALWAANEISKSLNDKFNAEIDEEIFSINKYVIEDYGSRFLGSQGKKVTLGYAKPDYFKLLLPEFDTNLHVLIDSIGLDKCGTLYETLIDKQQLRESDYPGKYYSINEYGSYGYANQPLITIENNNSANDLKVLILRDSYVNSMGPYFSLGVKSLSLVDLRDFTGSIRTYIDEYKPDIVISSLIGGEYDLTTGYDSHTNILDYR